METNQNQSHSQTHQQQIIPNKQCAVCNQTDKELLRCARCKAVYYCGVQCQKKHWPNHKLNCSKPKNQTLPSQPPQTKPEPENPFHGLNKFGKLTHIGSGNFSEIFKATNKQDGKLYAIKQVQKAKVQRIRKQADLFMEKHCLSKLKNCGYVIKLYQTFQDQLNLFIQMEYPQNGELWEQCKAFGLFSQSVYKYYAAHIVKAISIIHNQYQIVHRDLKPENILLNQKNQIKLIDFGTAKDLSRPDIKGSGNGLKGKKPFQHYVGTPNYMAPECIHNKASEKKADIYSLSGLLYFMKIGAPPFTGGSEFIVFKKSLQTQLYLCPQLFSVQLRDLINKMNHKDMEKRIDINEVMQHQYFKDVDFQNLPTYQQALKQCQPFETYLQKVSKDTFQKYHKIALEGTTEKRKEIYDKEIVCWFDKLLDGFEGQLTEEVREKMKRRIEMMKIQAKVMMNYHDDNSVGFVEVYNQDFDSAERLINQVKYGNKEGKKEKTQHKQNRQKESENEAQSQMKKKNYAEEVEIDRKNSNSQEKNPTQKDE